MDASSLRLPKCIFLFIAFDRLVELVSNNSFASTMKLVFTPLTARRAMVYCVQTSVTPPASQTPRLDDKLVKKFGTVWKQFESSETGWKKQIVFWTNKMLEQIPYEEWGLKSIPRQSAVLRRLKQIEAKDEKELFEKNEKLPVAEQLPVVQLEDIAKKHHEELLKVPLVFPNHLSTPDQAKAQLLKLAIDGAKHHRKYMIWCAIGAPLTLPVALLPVLPNLPGFYLVFRCWSHWKALEGANHLKHLIEDNHLEFVSSEQVFDAYNKAEDTHVLKNVAKLAEEDGVAPATPTSNETVENSLLVDNTSIDHIVETVQLPDLAAELKRARRQVVYNIDKEIKKREQK